MEQTVFTEAYLSPDVNGHFELTASNDLGESIAISNISENPVLFESHSADVEYNETLDVGICFWQESELGDGVYSMEASTVKSIDDIVVFWSRPKYPKIIARDIPVVE